MRTFIAEFYVPEAVGLWVAVFENPSSAPGRGLVAPTVFDEVAHVFRGGACPTATGMPTECAIAMVPLAGKGSDNRLNLSGVGL